MNNKNILSYKIEKNNKKAFKRTEQIRQAIKEQVFYNDGLILI